MINFQDKITEQFRDDIISSEFHFNELYLEVSAQSLRKLSLALSRDFGFPLVSMFAVDEKTRKNCYTIYYVFADRRSGGLVILTLPVNPVSGTFESLCNAIPATALYEREIKDLFGLIPVDHPIPKRLVFHGNWPKNLYPLRKEFPAGYRPEFANEKMEFTRISGEGVF